MNQLDSKQLPSYESLSELLREITEIDAARRLRLLDTWDKFYRKKEKSSPERCRRETQELIEKDESYQPSIAEDDTALPAGLESDLELIGLDEKLMWLPEPAQRYILELAREYDSRLCDTLPEARRSLLNEKLRRWHYAQHS